ncbi:MAG: Mur ligase family protein, partial [Coriobacteriia bacterium]|nr:Mur ligase family protein [Coriobacteriia bacterium]
MQLSVTEIAEAVSARIVAAPNPDAQITSVTWDSRTAGEGSLYVALAGERVDGHDYVLAAVSAGARCVLVTRSLPDEVVARVQELGAAILLVDDAQAAITDLARVWRGRLQGRIVGLTGSNGKTTTKNLVRDVLACAGSVTATRGNQNNELGVPNTLLAADADTLNVVVEMGMRGLGQIESLCSFVRPDWGIVTQVG